MKRDGSKINDVDLIQCSETKRHVVKSLYTKIRFHLFQPIANVFIKVFSQKSS